MRIGTYGANVIGNLTVTNQIISPTTNNISNTAQASFNQANTAGANTVYLQGIENTQNTNITNLTTSLSSNVSYFQGVENTQNTNITAVNTYATSAYAQANASNSLAQSAYNKANTSVTGPQGAQIGRAHV